MDSCMIELSQYRFNRAKEQLAKAEAVIDEIQPYLLKKWINETEK